MYQRQGLACLGPPLEACLPRTSLRTIHKDEKMDKPQCQRLEGLLPYTPGHRLPASGQQACGKRRATAEVS